MQYKFFTIPALESASMEGELNRFLRANRILTVNKELVCVNSTPFWFFCVEYLESSRALSRRGERIDYREILSSEDFAIFSKLRDMRKKLAEIEAVPVYAVCTNEQLAEMARRRDSSLSDLGNIQGIGKSKIEKYGKSFLSVLNENREEKHETSGESP